MIAGAVEATALGGAAPSLGALLAGRSSDFRPRARFGLRPAAESYGADTSCRVSPGPQGSGPTTARMVDPAAIQTDAWSPLHRTSAADAGSDANDARIDTAQASPGLPLAAPARAGGELGSREAEVDRAREDGFAAGWGAGHLAAETELGAGIAELDRLAGALLAARAIDPPTLAAALADTVHALLAELLDADPALAVHGVEARARHALEALAARDDHCVLWLAPADAAALTAPLARSGLSIVADPTLARGALRLTNAVSRIDDSPSARLASLAPMLAEAAAHAAAEDENCDGDTDGNDAANPMTDENDRQDAA